MNKAPIQRGIHEVPRSFAHKVRASKCPQGFCTYSGRFVNPIGALHIQKGLCTHMDTHISVFFPIDMGGAS